MSDKEATSELSSSVNEGAGYDEFYLSRHEPEKDFPRSSERELSTHSLNDEKENEEDEDKGDTEGDKYVEGQEEEEKKEDKEDEQNQSEGVESIGQDDGGARPFILLTIRTVNGFYPTMSIKVYNTLQDRYQILESIHLRLPKKFEKCYSGKTADIGIYEAMFAARLRLPLMDLHRQLANYLGLSISQVDPNAQRIFSKAEVIWGQFSGENRRLTLDEFFYY